MHRWLLPLPLPTPVITRVDTESHPFRHVIRTGAHASGRTAFDTGLGFIAVWERVHGTRRIGNTDDVGRCAIVSVSYSTKELTALLLWSLHRILEPADLSILIVDNASTDDSLELLTRAQDAGLCTLVVNPTNLGHGPALNRAFGTEAVKRAHRAWILDSDCVIARPDALSAALAAHPDAEVIGESHWDQWHQQMRPELYSLIVDPSALERPDITSFSEGGDPAWEFLVSAERAGLRMTTFPFTTEGYIIHRGRGSLAAVAEASDPSHPLYSWAIEHHEPHFGGIDGAKTRYARIIEQFADEVGPDLDLERALRS